MNFSHIIEMDIWSSFGCFSKPFSTTGGILTYLIPPKTSIIGIIGAVLGYEFDVYEENSNGIKKYKIEKLNNIKVSIQPLFDLKTKRITFNQVSGTVEKMNVINIHQDVLIKPRYKLFISFPDSLSNEEELFVERIKNQETIFNLYMGRNEFPLNYEFVNQFSYDSVILTKENRNDFFKKPIKIHGSLNRLAVKNVTLFSEKKSDLDEDVKSTLESIGIIFSNNDGETSKLKSYYEYLIKDYPVKRENFTDFKYSPISFYASDDFDSCYFSNLILKEGYELELTKIMENKWITMI